MKRLILLAVLLLAGCVRIQPKAAVLPSATPEMLIKRPDNAYSGTPVRTLAPTPEVYPIVLTVTAMSIKPVQATKAPEKFEPVIIGDFMLEYLGNSVTEFLGDKCVEISYRFTNNSTETAHFGGSFSTSAFQDGIELKLHFADNSESSTDIRPGKSVIVKDAFYLRSNSPVIELEFYPFLRLWSQPVSRTITLK